MEMTKTYTASGIEAKEDGERGLVRAVFATLNVVDADGDVTLPGAFGEQRVKLSAWGHAWGSLPVGRGGISEEGDKALFDGQFFLDTEAGREHFRTVRNLADLQEWSYGFTIQESGEGEFEERRVRFLKKLKVHEVSPVMLGAGVDTRTLDIKAEGWTYLDHAEYVLAHVKALAERSGALAALRAGEGRDLSSANRERLASLAEKLQAVQEEIAQVLASREPDVEKALRQVAEYQATLARVAGVTVS